MRAFHHFSSCGRIFLCFYYRCFAHFSLLQHVLSHFLDVFEKKCVLENRKGSGQRGCGGARSATCQGRGAQPCTLPPFQAGSGSRWIRATWTRGRIAAVARARRSPMGPGSWLPPRACGLHGAVHASTRPYVGRSVRVRIRVCTGLFFIVVGVYTARTI